MVTESEREALDPDITQELTPDEITLVDPDRFVEFESGCVVLVPGTPPLPPRRAKVQPQDPHLAGESTVEPALGDVDSEDASALQRPACDEDDPPATLRRN